MRGMPTGYRMRWSVPLFLACLVAAPLTGCSSGPSPDGPLKAFATAWSGDDLKALQVFTPAGATLTGAQAQTILDTVTGDLTAVRPAVTVKRKPTVKDDRASGTLTVAWPLAKDVTWSYDTTVELRRKGDRWRVVFEPRVVHPNLTETTKLAVRRSAADRGGILDNAGQPIVTQRPVVTVGVQPNALPNPPVAIGELTAAIARVEPTVSLTDLAARIAAATPDAFVEVVTLRKEKYLQIRAELQAIQGTRFKESSLPLAPTSVFARALLGSTGEVTKEIMDKNPGKYQIGDRVGLSGLQQRYDDVLRGSPGVQVTIPVPQGGSGTATTLFTSDPKPGAAVRTTLDPKTQTAADGALAGETRRSALVAIRISDGSVVAVANGPGGGQLNLALTAQVPPGSTFKMVTALGVLDNGSVTADATVACPQTLVVGGRTFSNSHEMVLGDAPLHVDFAKSCNTAFASLAPKLGPDGLAKTATTLGVGAPWDLGVDAFAGKVSSGGSETEQAAAAFGQGTTIVSPIAMAGATAAVARGQWKQPTLVTEPAPAKPAADGPQLKPTAVEPLRAMMREVVTAGTADALKRIDGLHGKTGTAEYDSNDLAKTHSWFIGFKGDIAFAVFVENGGLGSAAAVPITGKFFQLLG